VKHNTRRTTARTGAPAQSRDAAGRWGLAILWIGTLAGIVLGVRALEPYAHAAGGAEPWRLQWVQVPATIEDWVLSEIQNERQTYDLRPLFAADVHTPELCMRLAEELSKSPWIASVERISKQADGLANVHAQFRRYLTFVVRDGMGYLVDDSGVRLPRQHLASTLDAYGMVLVEGAREAPPEVGRPWPGGDVAAGLKLVKFLSEQCPPALLTYFRAVDVTNFKDRLNRRDGWLKIRTLHSNRYILWGLPPGEEFGIESNASRKLALLWAHYSKYGQLPSRDRIDVRDADSIAVPQTP